MKLIGGRTDDSAIRDGDDSRPTRCTEKVLLAPRGFEFSVPSAVIKDWSVPMSASQPVGCEAASIVR